jgi:photosystem II stability/assembly factor-like uncharacterized protein
MEDYCMKTRLYITITMFLLLYAIGGALAQEWIPADVGSKTWDVGFSFRDICFATIDPSKGWAVGDEGTILHSGDGGVTWVEQNSPVKISLYGVFFLDANTGWAVGDGNTIIRTTNGSDWNIVTSNPPGAIFRDIYFTDSNHGWIVGDKNTILYWNGSSWSPRKWDTDQNPNLYGVQFIDSNIGWAVGDNGTLITTNDGGVNWDPLPTDTSLRLNKLCFISADTGWIVGDGGTILYKSKNGITKQNGGGLNTLYDVDFINNNEGWICGSAGLTNILLNTTNGGVSWQPDTVPFAKSVLYAMDFMRRDSGIVVGMGGSIIRFTANAPGPVIHLTEPSGDINILTPTFKWTTNKSGLTYMIYISNESDPFKKPIYQPIAVTNGTSYTLPEDFALSSGDYYWGIKVDDVQSSEVLRFTVWSPTEIVMISPIGFIKDSKPTFKWHWMDNADYTLYIDTDPNPFDGKSFGVGKIMNYTISSSDPWKNLPEGIYYWGISGNNNGQITKSTTNPSFTIDLTPPKGTIVINDGSKATKSIIVSLKLSASDLIANGTMDGSGVVQMQLSNDGKTWSDLEPFKPDTMTKSWDLSKYGGDGKDGQKTVYVRYKDALYHLSDPIKSQIFVDNTSPTGTVKINSGAEATNKFDVTLTLSATDVGLGMVPDGIMTLSNDNKMWSDPLPYSTTRNWDLSNIGGNKIDGNKTVYVKYKDPAGNEMTTPATATIKVDTTGPNGTIAINDGAVEANSLLVKLTLSAIDVSGVKEMHFSNGENIWSDPEPYKTTKDNWDLSKFGGNSSDGFKNVFVRFIDTLGNETIPSPQANITLNTKTVNKYPPVVTNIPDQTIVAGKAFTSIKLDDYVSDRDNVDSQIIWTVTGNSKISVTIDVNRIATIKIADTAWRGNETATFTAKDPAGLSASDTVKFTVKILIGDVNKDGSIKSNDVILILQIVVGIKVPNDYEKVAADVNGDGVIRSNDAIKLLSMIIGIGAPEIDTLKEIQKPITLALSELHGISGDIVTLPLIADDVRSLAGGDVCITYNNAVLQAIDVSSASNVLMASKITDTGIVRIAFADSKNLNGNTLAYIKFKVLADGISPLKLRNADLYGFDGNIIKTVYIDKEFRSWAVAPEQNVLMQNYPNPFNPETWIPFQLKEDSNVKIIIYSLAGELVREFEIGYKPSGVYTSQDKALYWDGKDKYGQHVSSGAYFYTISAGNFNAVKKLIILK